MAETVILAAGSFPRRGSQARQLLERARRVVCCDGAADLLRRHTGREPTLVVGDCDSLTGRFRHVQRLDEQDTNDLEKAIRACALRGWKRPVVLGATGKREDHALGNVFRVMAQGLEMVTDYGRFVPIVDRSVFRVRIGSPVSVFANPGTRMTSTGLAWALDDVSFADFHCATLNRASASRVVITTSRPAYVYWAASDTCGAAAIGLRLK